MTEEMVLFGAGAAGRYALKFLRERGVPVACFVDNDQSKQREAVDGEPVLSPQQALQWVPKATWVATAISRPAAPQIRAQMWEMGVQTKPLWECIPVCHGLPPTDDMGVRTEGRDSFEFYRDQIAFREKPDYDSQMDPLPASEIYFPEFIKRLGDEHFLDCGAADGDTVTEFLGRWPMYERITALEPDRKNFAKLMMAHGGKPKIGVFPTAVGDKTGTMTFAATGDYSAHIADEGGESVSCVTIDDFVRVSGTPTYIKMDIEGFELEALWGARHTLKLNNPVLAICAYHTSDHLWQIPLLIHAIQPEYRLFFRRYAEGAFELVWYAVPKDRLA